MAAATWTDDVIGDGSVGLALMAQIHQEYPDVQDKVILLHQSNIVEQLGVVVDNCYPRVTNLANSSNFMSPAPGQDPSSG